MKVELLVVACAAGLAASAVAGETPPEPEAAMRLEADIFAREEPDILYAIGHVRLQRGLAVLTADGAVVWLRDREAYLEGHVVYRFGKSVLECDRAYVHWTSLTDEETGKTSTVVDRGFLIQPNVRWAERPDRVPWHLKAEEVLQTDPRRFLARGRVILSPNEFHAPHTYFRASRVEFVKDEKIIITDVTYNVQGVSLPPGWQGWWVPPLYWPKLYVPLGYRWPEVDVEAGRSSRFGTYVRSEVRYQLAEDYIPLIDTTVGVELDYYSKRGFAYGGLLEWMHEDLIRGELRHYRLDDDDGMDRDRYELGTTDRYRTLLLHSQDFPEGWELDVEYQRWSDAGFRQEFFEEDYLEDKPIESRVYLKHTRGPLAFYFHYRWREDDWLDTTELQPQLGVNVVSYPLWRNLVYTGHFEVARVRRRLSDLRLDPGQSATDPDHLGLLFEENFIHRPLRSTPQEALSDDEGFWRVNTYHELAAPFEVSIFDVEPFVGVRGTYYGETLDGDSDWRVLTALGGRVSTQFWRAWDDVRSDGLRVGGVKLLPLEVDGIRHVVTPEVRVLAVEDAGLDFDDLLLTDDDETNQPPSDTGFDGYRLIADPRLAMPVSRSRLYYGYDTTGLAFGDVYDIHPFRVVHFALRNRWQTRRQERVVDLVDLDANIDLFFGDQDVNNDDTWSDFRLDFRFRPIDGITFFTDLDYNVPGNDYLRRSGNAFTTNDDHLRVINSGLSVATSKRWQLVLAQRYEKGHANRFGVRFIYVPSEKWRLVAQYEYDARDDDEVEVALRVIRDLHDWIAEFIFEDDNDSDEQLVGFRLRPKLRRELITGLYFTRELGSAHRAERQETFQAYDY